MINKTLKNSIFCLLVLSSAGILCKKAGPATPKMILHRIKFIHSLQDTKAFLAKIYGGLASGGNQGPAGQPDISGGLDEGSQIAFITSVF